MLGNMKASNWQCIPLYNPYHLSPEPEKVIRNETTSKDPTEGLRCFRQLLSDEAQNVRETAAKSKIAWEALLKQHPKEGLGRLGAWISASKTGFLECEGLVWFVFVAIGGGDIVGSDEGRFDSSWVF